MGRYESYVLPRCINLLCGAKAMRPVRSRSMEGLSGVVLELGFGSGTNVGLYPAEVTRIVAVEPSADARKLAAKRIARSAIPIEFVGLDGQSIPLADDSVDHALSTWTLCTIPDLSAALSEVKRVLRPGGRLFFLEHGLSPVPAVARRQARFEPWQKRFAGGCHLTRDMASLLADAGFVVDDLAEFDLAGPKIMGHMYSGQAVPV